MTECVMRVTAQQRKPEPEILTRLHPTLIPPAMSRAMNDEEVITELNKMVGSSLK